jgi:hypothetical protein
MPRFRFRILHYISLVAMAALLIAQTKLLLDCIARGNKLDVALVVFGFAIVDVATLVFWSWFGFFALCKSARGELDGRIQPGVERSSGDQSGEAKRV